MTDSDEPIHRPPPPRRPEPIEDTGRYVAWMARAGRPIHDKAREDTSLRICDWGFFDHGGTAFRDRAALDRAGHVVLATDRSDDGSWHALLTTPGLDAEGAHARVAWLFRAAAVTGKPARREVTPPTLTIEIPTVTFEGWLLYPPNMGRPLRIAIRATALAARIVHGPDGPR